MTYKRRMPDGGVETARYAIHYMMKEQKYGGKKGEMIPVEQVFPIFPSDPFSARIHIARIRETCDEILGVEELKAE